MLYFPVYFEPLITQSAALHREQQKIIIVKKTDLILPRTAFDLNQSRFVFTSVYSVPSVVQTL